MACWRMGAALLDDLDLFLGFAEPGVSDPDGFLGLGLAAARELPTVEFAADLVHLLASAFDLVDPVELLGVVDPLADRAGFPSRRRSRAFRASSMNVRSASRNSRMRIDRS